MKGDLLRLAANLEKSALRYEALAAEATSKLASLHYARTATEFRNLAAQTRQRAASRDTEEKGR